MWEQMGCGPTQGCGPEKGTLGRPKDTASGEPPRLAITFHQEPRTWPLTSTCKMPVQIGADGVVLTLQIMPKALLLRT